MTEVLNPTVSATFEEFEQGLNGLKESAFHQKRRNALQEFKRVGFPHKKHEEYRYLNLSAVKKTDFQIPKKPDFSGLDVSDFLIPGLQVNLLVFVDGYYSEKHSSILDSETFTISGLDKAPEDLVKNYFSEYPYANDNPFSALNIAFAVEGAYIQIKKGKVVEHPIHILSLNTGVNWVQPHNIVVAEENAQAKIIETFYSMTDHGLDNSFLRIVTKPHSIIDHYKLQALGSEAQHFGTTHIRQESKSVCTTHVYNLSGKLVRNNIHIDIEDEHTEANMYGLYVTDGNEVVDNHTLVNHKVANCVSNQLYKGVMNGHSKAVFNGKIFVQRDAQVTNAFQSNRNIVLSDDASINTKPQLEIWADDVKCSHGATIGKLSKDEIFYLRTRGIDEDKAKSILTYAFAGEVLSHITIPQFRSFLEDGVAAKLGFEL